MKLSRLWLLAAVLSGVGVVVGLAKPPPGSAPVGSAGLRTNTPVLRTNSTWLGHRTPGFVLSRKLSGAAIAPPGVYVSEPYKCLVVVPEPHPDDRCLIAGGGGPTTPMPMFAPDLHLVPFGK